MRPRRIDGPVQGCVCGLCGGIVDAHGWSGEMAVGTYAADGSTHTDIAGMLGGGGAVIAEFHPDTRCRVCGSKDPPLLPNMREAVRALTRAQWEAAGCPIYEDRPGSPWWEWLKAQVRWGPAISRVVDTRDVPFTVVIHQEGDYIWSVWFDQTGPDAIDPGEESARPWFAKRGLVPVLRD